jgi:hypothetical protein
MSDVASVFVDAARALARQLLRATTHLEWAHIAVEHLLALMGHDLARRREGLVG